MLVALLATACVSSVDYEPLLELPGGSGWTEIGPAEVELQPGTPEEPHREIGRVTVQGRVSRSTLERALRRRAFQAGAEAVIRVRMSSRTYSLPVWARWLFWVLPEQRRLDGTAVVFTGTGSVRHPPTGGGDRP